MTTKKYGTEVKHALLWLKSKLQSEDTRERIAARVILNLLKEQHDPPTGKTWEMKRK